MRLRPFLPLLLLGLAGCGGQPMGSVKGHLALNGQPFPLPAGCGDIGVVFQALDEEGKTDPFKMYMTVVKPDGSFELVSSDGKLPVGLYKWSIDSGKGAVPEFAPFAMDVSKRTIEFKPGPNVVTLELAVPK